MNSGFLGLGAVLIALAAIYLARAKRSDAEAGNARLMGGFIFMAGLLSVAAALFPLLNVG
jgi:hypothetical protein